MPCFSSIGIATTHSSVPLRFLISDIDLVKFLDRGRLFCQRCSNKSVFLQYAVIAFKTKQPGLNSVN